MKHTYFTAAKLKYRAGLTIADISLKRHSMPKDSFKVQRIGSTSFTLYGELDSAVAYANSLLEGKE